MKRKIFAALAISAIAFVSCKKEEPTAPAEPGSATVQGTLWANTNVANDTDDLGWPMTTYETAPSGITVTAVIDSYDLDQTPDNSYDYQELHWTATTDANGNFTFSDLPCYNEMINCQLRINDFSYDADPSANVLDWNYAGGTINVSIWNGAIIIQDYTY